MESIEASGKSVEEAVQQALLRLGRRRDEVEVTVLQEPSRGAFGLGSREARVRVTVRPSRGAVITPEMADAILSQVEAEDEEEDFFADASHGAYDSEEEFEDFPEEGESDQGKGTTRYGSEPSPFLQQFQPSALSQQSPGDQVTSEPSSPPSPASVAPAGSTSASAPVAPSPSETSAGSSAPQEPVQPTREDIELTVDVLQHILRYMNIRASVQVRSTDPLTLNIQGIHENLGLLIGRRGETLSALQLLVNLIVSHRTKRRMRIIVDAENYRQRREENLRSLALRVAQQVRNYRRSIALEAMPPHERRIVHLALADSQDISTESIGEGDARRVVISLKRPGRS
ncbi:RNA-binding cell elongation regulator Jag/EloR [Thermogemmatispora sp.]|uniref:RNA-binding cell elongation regulator Jag/EloR n=1 Tax=Thermogemmatispora sp. TaxID=1968838 RepID=UPI001DC33452|nr:RNA-binding cell elongation regulator Jag/EloR [Thermogemmatispora sp.]MBX5450359.1 Jag N-terminal domain-containing protein [Thermogemmatispora sp.]